MFTKFFKASTIGAAFDSEVSRAAGAGRIAATLLQALEADYAVVVPTAPKSARKWLGLQLVEAPTKGAMKLAPALQCLHAALALIAGGDAPVLVGSWADPDVIERAAIVAKEARATAKTEATVKATAETVRAALAAAAAEAARHKAGPAAQGPSVPALETSPVVAGPLVTEEEVAPMLVAPVLVSAGAVIDPLAAAMSLVLAALQNGTIAHESDDWVTLDKALDASAKKAIKEARKSKVSLPSALTDTIPF